MLDQVQPEALGTSRPPTGPVTPNTEAGGAATVWLSSLDLGKMIQGFQKPVVNKSVGGHSLSISGRKFNQGVGTHAESILTVDLKRGAKRFTASVGVDDEVRNSKASVEFEVLGDGQVLWTSELMKAGDPAKEVDVDLSGISLLTLLVNDGG